MGYASVCYANRGLKKYLLFMQAPYELLVRLATLPALHTNNGSSAIVQRWGMQVYAMPTEV
jgi:hypothetical protein